MEIQLPYGRENLTVLLPNNQNVDILEAPDLPEGSNPQDVVRTALDHLHGDLDWEGFSNVKSVGIAVNDKTRPVPHGDLLPPLLKRLEAMGIPDEAITFYIAVGTHPPMVTTEFPEILPIDVLNRYTVVSHDSEDPDILINLGKTSIGTQVWSNRAYFQSGLKIVIGNIEPHQFVGFSGGVKSAAIGLSGITTINQNHVLMTDPASKLGIYNGNPTRIDIEEIGLKIGIHLAINAILNRQRKIVHVLAGDPRAVMEAGVPLARQACQIAVPQPYKVMIASPGGHPKDINVYQSQKGMFHAARVTQTGGTMILTAACTEGPGSTHYEEWMVGKKSYDDVLERFQAEGFRVGPHKAYLIARDALRIRLFLYSEMDEQLAKSLLLNPVADLQTAIDNALTKLQPEDRIGVLPHAASTIPYLESSRGV